MIAHIGHWTTTSWILIGIFLGMLGVGVALAVVGGRGGTGEQAHELLAQRLARGEIGPDEYRERSELLGPRRRRLLTPVSTVIIAAGLVGAIAAAATAGHGFMHSMMGPGMGSMMGSGQTHRSGSAPVAGARELHVAAQEFSFQPSEIRVRVGETINVLFENRGRMFHTFTVSGLGLDLHANSGDEIAGSLRAERAGTYSFMCTVSGHAAAGMQGNVIVSG
jgi:plastocyanin